MKTQLAQRLIPKRSTWSRRFVSVTQKTLSAPQQTRMLLVNSRPSDSNFYLLEQHQHQQQQLRGMVIGSQHKANDADDAAATSSSAVKVTVTESGSSTPQSSNQDASSLIITDACWNRIRELMVKKQKQSNGDKNDLYLRVFVDAGGCSGFSYNFEMDTAEHLEDDDVIFSPEHMSQDAAAVIDDSLRPRVVVDPESLQLMKGATLDYVTELIKSSFEIRDNPLSESACGCGSSFALKNFSANPAVD